MKAEQYVSKLKNEQDNLHLFEFKKKAGRYECPRADRKGVKHGSKFIEREGNSFYCGHKDEKNVVCFYHFTGNKGRK